MDEQDANTESDDSPGAPMGSDDSELEKPPRWLPPELQGPKTLRDKETGQLIGHVTAEEFEFLARDLEEDREDPEFYIDAATIDMLESNSTPASLVTLLRRALGSAEGIEVTWAE